MMNTLVFVSLVNKKVMWAYILPAPIVIRISVFNVIFIYTSIFKYVLDVIDIFLYNQKIKYIIINVSYLNNNYIIEMDR